MEKFSGKKKLAIVKQYLSGLSYGEIAVKNGISKGSVANVVTDLKGGRVPEASDGAEHIEMLRELSQDLRRSNLTPGQSATGLIVLARINECGLDPADIDRWPLILKSVSSEAETREFIKTIYHVEDVQKKTGLSLEDLHNKVDELEKKAADLEPVSSAYEERVNQVAELTRQRDGLANTVANLEDKYKLLNPRVKDLEKREQTLLGHIEEMEARAEKAEASLTALSKERQGLLDTGLSPEALAEFSHRVQSIAERRSIPPEEIRQWLLQELETLDQTVGLEALVQGRKSELEELEQATAQTKRERESLKGVVSGLQQQKADLETDIKETRDKVSREVAKIIPMAKNTINHLEAELRRGHSEALAEVRRLRDESLEVGKEFGRWEQIIQANKWLSDLLTLVRGDGIVEGKQVRVILLLVLRGLAVWLKQNKARSLGLPTLPLHTENLIREVEQWNV